MKDWRRSLESWVATDLGETRAQTLVALVCRRPWCASAAQRSMVRRSLPRTISRAIPNSDSTRLARLRTVIETPARLARNSLEAVTRRPVRVSALLAIIMATA